MTPTIIDRSSVDLTALQKRQGHKYDHGHALVLSGGAGRTGAALLAARGALRIGAGAVTLGVPPAAHLEVAMQIGALMLARIADAAALAELLQDDRINVMCLGPAMGLGERPRLLLAAALQSGRALVLDADALTLMANDEALFALLHDNCVLTPHGGEFARLFPDVAEAELHGMAKAEAAAKAAQRAGACVIYKGPETHVATPQGDAYVHEATGARAVPWLATAGAGDVLAGFVTGLCARGLAPGTAAALAVWLHVECALGFGPGLIAEDLPERLPQVLRRLGL